MDFESHNISHIKAECARYFSSKSKTKSLEIKDTKESILLGIIDYRKLYSRRKSKKIRIN
jgi:hypothetical protein|tara:strand:- start:1217 stop:1396 length:180 start_codon:yes stop_codon:yes gene_type:complete